MTGIIILAIIVVLIVIFIGYIISLYNSLVRVKNNVKKAWSNISVLLKQRHDELPKLIDACKAYMQHEKSVLENITQARADAQKARESGNIADVNKAESAVGRSLMNLMAVAENYPDLKANASFQQLQQRISSIEDQIADRRELYNQTANNYNIAIQQFPAVILAGMMSFDSVDLLKFSEDETKDVDVGQSFNS